MSATINTLVESRKTLFGRRNFDNGLITVRHAHTGHNEGAGDGNTDNGGLNFDSHIAF
jgi:hypothetical protein